MNSEKINQQAEIFTNRLTKRYKHLKKWAKREQINCFRLYDKDIPEIPLCVDIYTDIEGNKYAVVFLYERPYEKDESEEKLWLSIMEQSIVEVLDIPEENIFTKVRKRQRDGQYEKITRQEFIIVVEEFGSRFRINLASYLDSGLFFDHRPLRKIVKEQSAEKRVLNLFCYTGSFSVHAANGGAKVVDSVDLSKTYLSWVAKNFELNPSTQETRHHIVNEDVLTFLKKTDKTWDLIILDPPTFSNSKKTETVLDINRDYADFIKFCLKRLSKNGTLYFSTNSRTLKFDENLFNSQAITIQDITNTTIPEDFRNTKIHRCWKICYAT